MKPSNIEETSSTENEEPNRDIDQEDSNLERLNEQSVNLTSSKNTSSNTGLFLGIPPLPILGSRSLLILIWKCLEFQRISDRTRDQELFEVVGYLYLLLPRFKIGGQSSPLGLYSEYIGEWVCVKIFFPSLMMFKVNVLGAIEIIIPDIGCMTFVFGL